MSNITLTAFSPYLSLNYDRIYHICKILPQIHHPIVKLELIYQNVSRHIKQDESASIFFIPDYLPGGFFKY